MPPPSNLSELLGLRARENGDSVALRIRDDRITYGELEERSGHLARALHDIGVGAGDRVGFLGKTCRQYFEILFAAAKLGAVTVPVNWRLASPEIAGILADAEVGVLFVDDACAPLAREVGDRLTALRHRVGIGDERLDLDHEVLIAAATAPPPEVTRAPGDIVLQVYTSGTTGQPKGVMLGDAALLEYLRVLARVARFEPRSTSLCSLPMFHIGGNGWALAGIFAGAENVVLPETDPAELLATIERFAVTVTFAVPAVLKMMLDSPAVDRTDLGSLRTVYYGGSPITETVLRRAIEVLGCDFVQGFGLTECGLVAALDPADHDVDGRPELLRSCGRVVPPNEARLVDPETLAEVPTGDVGELWVRSPFVMSGYFRRPEETEAALTPDGWLRTGDAGRLDGDGYLFIEDRLKDMIISGGENIYSAEVENVLMTHDGVADCAAVGVPSERWGETVRAVVVPRTGSSLTEIDLIAFCREGLAGYKCPTSVEFVADLPRTPSGKVMKHQLRPA